MFGRPEGNEGRWWVISHEEKKLCTAEEN